MFTNRGLTHFKRISKLASLAFAPSATNSHSPIFTTAFQWKNFRSPIKFSKPRSLNEVESDSLTESWKKVEENDEEEYIDNLIDRSLLRFGGGQQVFVIQPFIKWGPNKKRNTTPQLQLLESVTLIKTLREWKVVGELIIGVESFRKKTFFGKGNLQMLQELVQNCKLISAVFISVNTLNLAQQTTLHEIFGVPVFDRYTIVIQIFREHATSREAKLQIKLAELPYLWTVLKGMNYGMGEKFGCGPEQIGGFGPKLLEYRKEIFRAREAKLKRLLAEVREHRQLLRKAREEKELPVVAVVGYTNAGKTSLIKVLTGKESLEPQDYLFATLDVTCYLGKLPSGLNAYFVDTLGFINDIPTYLIESFVSTLEDATFADVIVHVRDISHPDTIAQNENVTKTLKELNLSEESIKNVITVGNKIDLLEPEKLEKYKNKNMILVSCNNLTGIDVLREEIEKKILSSSGKIKMVIRVKSGSEEYDWLHLQTTVVKESPDPKDCHFMLMYIITTPSVMGKFKHYFITNYKKR